MKKRELLAAGIVRDYRFQNEEAYHDHLLDLDVNAAECEYEILEKQLCKDGTVLARIVTQYKNADLINLEA